MGGPVFPLLNYHYNADATEAHNAFLDFHNIALDYGKEVARGRQTDDAKWLGKMDRLMKKVSDYFGEQKVEPVTGDYVYFTNSRFTPAVYKESGRIGENAIAVQQGIKPVGGKTLFAGLGLTRDDEDGMKKKLKELLYSEPQKIQAWVTNMAARPAVIAAAANFKNASDQPMTPEEYAKSIFDKAAASDIGIAVIARPTLTKS